MNSLPAPECRSPIPRLLMLGPLLFVGCRSSHECDDRTHANRVLLVEDGEATLENIGSDIDALARDQAGAVWSIRDDVLFEDGHEVGGLTGYLEDIARLGDRVAVLEESPEYALLLRDPADAEPVELAPAGSTYGGVLAEYAGTTWIVEHTRNGSSTGPIQIWRDDGAGWSSEVLEGFVASWTPLAAAAGPDGLAFAWYRNMSFHLVTEADGAWTELASEAAHDLSGLVVDADGTPWMALASEPDKARIVQAGVCAVDLDDLAPHVALAVETDGVVAYGFALDGAAWRVSLSADCTPTAEQLTPSVGDGLDTSWRAHSGDGAVVLGDFVVGEDGADFEDPYVPACY